MNSFAIIFITIVILTFALFNLTMKLSRNKFISFTADYSKPFLKAPINGRIVSCREQINIKEGKTICFIESYRIKVKIKSPVNGKINNCLIQNNSFVRKTQNLFEVIEE
ncbi:MAG: hypothetical protein JXR63_13435 [Spirochaetales bacterium]|nr:hypothetical protein [Spirochaetales bacterium]